jgi:hypothetical protein
LVQCSLGLKGCWQCHLQGAHLQDSVGNDARKQEGHIQLYCIWTTVLGLYEQKKRKWKKSYRLRIMHRPTEIIQTKSLWSCLGPASGQSLSGRLSLRSGSRMIGPRQATTTSRFNPDCVIGLLGRRCNWPFKSGSHIGYDLINAGSKTNISPRDNIAPFLRHGKFYNFLF